MIGGPPVAKQSDAAILQNERLRRFYENFASGYDAWMERFDRWMLGDGRERLGSRAGGQVLEVAVGTGLNLPYYPREAQLTGIDLTPAMLSLAGRRAQALGIYVDLRLGDAHDLDFADESFDTVIFTLSLCTIPDERRALAEAFRVLRPGGQLLLLEHVRSPVRLVRWVERLLNPLLVRLAGDHLLRDPVDHLAALGFSVERCDRARWGFVEEVVARKGQERSDCLRSDGQGPVF